MKIAVVNGPNLNLLGKRNKNHYGEFTLANLNALIEHTFPNVEFAFFQSNHEGSIVDYLQDVTADGLIINAAAYTHTSIAIHDVLEILTMPKVEVHLSDVNNREAFRKINYIKDVVDLTISGKKEQGYIEAVQFILEKLNNIK